MKKARTWLDTHGVTYTFHDYKVHGIDQVRLAHWVDELSWDALLNTSGTTFRKLADVDKRDLTESKAIALMLAQPSMIRRPVLDLGTRRIVGFSPDRYAAALS